MTSELLYIVIGVVIFLIYRNRDKATGVIKIPDWIWKVIGGFMLVMLIMNIRDVISFLSSESGAWWPLVKNQATEMSADLRHLLESMMKGSG